MKVIRIYKREKDEDRSFIIIFPDGDKAGSIWLGYDTYEIDVKGNMWVCFNGSIIATIPAKEYRIDIVEPENYFFKTLDKLRKPMIL